MEFIHSIKILKHECYKKYNIIFSVLNIPAHLEYLEVNTPKYIFNEEVLLPPWP